MANKKWKLSDGDLWATDGVYDFGQSKTQRQINSDLNGAITSDPSNRLKGKQIAIYGDSWASDSYGKLGADYIATVTGVEVHKKNFGGATLDQIRTTSWDSYNADIYIIEGGLNDASGSTGGNTFITAITDWLTAIRTVNADAEIYFVTPPYVTVSGQINYLFPIEFYRLIMWRMSAKNKFHVINALKWTNVKLLSDNLHPTTDSYEWIGKYIVASLINYGDEETYNNETTNFGRSNNQLLFACIDGQMQIRTQVLNVTPTTTGYYHCFFKPNGQGGGDNVSTTFGNTETPYRDDANGSFGIMQSSTMYQNRVSFYSSGIVAGQTLSNRSATLPVTLLYL